MPERLTQHEILTRAARGLGKVDQNGLRGITNVTTDEIEAMAAALAIFGLVPIYPGAPVPDQLVINFTGETDV